MATMSTRPSGTSTTLLASTTSVASWRLSTACSTMTLSTSDVSDSMALKQHPSF